MAITHITQGETAMFKKITRIAFVLLAVGGLSLATSAPSASAATARNGVCDAGEFCLYYYANYGGSVSDFSGSVSDYGSSQPTCYEFRGAGAGQGQCVKNNAMSVWNRTTRAVTVYYNSGYAGTSQTFASQQYTNLSTALSNNNASHLFR